MTEYVKNQLRMWARQYHCRAFIADDPIQFPHRHTGKADIEISGLLTALLSFGARPQILKKADALDNLMQGHPHRYLLSGRWQEDFPVERHDSYYRMVSYATVRAWFEGETFAEDTYVETPYTVEYSTGPMLKFTNYNDYLHYFTFPGGNGGFQGYKGDYEFTFMDMSHDGRITMRGIKTENDIILYPLPDGYTPEEYVDAVRESQKSVTPTSLKLMVNGRQYGTVTRSATYDENSFERCYQSKLWTVSYTYQQQRTDSLGEPMFDEQTGEPVYEDINVNDVLSFICYHDGTMRLYEPYTFKGGLEGLRDQTIQTFEWRKGAVPASDCFVCTDSLLEIRLEQ